MLILSQEQIFGENSNSCAPHAIFGQAIPCSQSTFDYMMLSMINAVLAETIMKSQSPSSCHRCVSLSSHCEAHNSDDRKSMQITFQSLTGKIAKRGKEKCLVRASSLALDRGLCLVSWQLTANLALCALGFIHPP